MARVLFSLAFSLGALAIIWMSWVFATSDAFALLITLAIGVAYLVGFVELFQFRKSTATLVSSLDRLNGQTPVEDLEEWLTGVDAGLRHSVRLRIEGERVGLPGLSLTPFLGGLLVMLGLLGTFVGMVDTLKGAVIALQGSTELSAIREGLAAPIKGLGLAFGTSVAGVAGSAMLGLIAALCRRERSEAVRTLDAKLNRFFKSYSKDYGQQQAFDQLQQQMSALPVVAEQLSLVADKLADMGQGLNQQLVSNQDSFHESTQSVYKQLADSVGESLKDAITETGRLTGESIKPIVQQVMHELSGEIQAGVESTHNHLTQTTEQQLKGLTDVLDRKVNKLSVSFEAAASQQVEASQALIEQVSGSLNTFNSQYEQLCQSTVKTYRDASHDTVQQVVAQSRDAVSPLLDKMSALFAESENLVTARIETESNWAASQKERMTEMSGVIQSELSSLRQEEQHRGDQAVERLSDLETAVAKQLAELGVALEEPMTRLIETASETPKAAAEVIGHLRNEISKNIERDNSLLEERQKIMEELSTLSSSMEQASQAQNSAAQLLVNSSTEMLENVGSRFTQQMETEVSRIGDIVEHFSSSAIEMSSLSDSFGTAITLFNESNQGLIDNLNRIEGALDKSNERSDEQLGYYVAQAREIIDHSMLSQKEVFEEIRKLSKSAEVAATEAG